MGFRDRAIFPGGLFSWALRREALHFTSFSAAISYRRHTITVKVQLNVQFTFRKCFMFPLKRDGVISLISRLQTSTPVSFSKIYFRTSFHFPNVYLIGRLSFYTLTTFCLSFADNVNMVSSQNLKKCIFYISIADLATEIKFLLFFLTHSDIILSFQ